MNRTQHRRLIPLSILTLLVVVATGALPAAARQDSGPAHLGTNPYSCQLQRVGTQYVACDNLTGNGVPAPAWVDER